MQKKHVYENETENEIARGTEIERERSRDRTGSRERSRYKETPKIKISSYQQRLSQEEVETHKTNMHKTNDYFLIGNRTRHKIPTQEIPVYEQYDNVLRDRDHLNNHRIREDPGSNHLYFSPTLDNENIIKLNKDSQLTLKETSAQVNIIRSAKDSTSKPS